MRDRWDRLASGLLEAGWLACAVGVPLFLSPALALAFTADKVLLFRCLAEVLGLVALLAWLRRPRLQPAPLTMALGAYTVALVLATLFGRSLSQGFWGSYLRLFGLFTLLHGGVLYLVVAGCLRSERQWRRLLVAVAMTSLVVCGYAMIQWLGLESGIMSGLLGQTGFHWAAAGAERYRPFATLGNPSFLGAFLVFAIAFALGALLMLPRGRRWPGVLLLGLLTLVLVLNQTRGAWLAVMALGVTFALIIAPPEKRRRIAVAAGALALAVSIFGFACARSANAPWVTSNRVCTRLAHFLQHDPNSSGWYRLNMWRRVATDVAASPGALLLGYGPESYLLVSSRSFVPSYADGPQEAQFMDSTHNIFTDALIDSGLLGLVALLAVLFLGFRTAMRALRSVSAPAQRAVLTTALSALVGYVVQGIFLFDHVITLVYLSLTLGLIAAASRTGWGALQPEATAKWAKGSEKDFDAKTRSERKGEKEGQEEGRARPKVRPIPILLGSFRGLRFLRAFAPKYFSLPFVHFASFAPFALSRRSPFRLLSSISRAALALAAVAFVCGVLLPINGRAIQAQVWKRCAEELAAAGRTDEATAALRETCRLVPGERTYHVALAASIVAGVSPQESDPARLRAVFQEAEQELRRASAIDPGDVRTYWPLGQLYQYWGVLDRGKFAEGEAVYRRAAALSPRRQRTYWAWGDLMLAEGKPAASEALYRHALELDPSVAASQRSLAQLYVRLGKPEKAESLFAEAWRRTGSGPVGMLSRPQRAAEHEALGLAFLARGRGDKARAYLTGALDLEPELPRAREALARLSRQPVSG